MAENDPTIEEIQAKSLELHAKLAQASITEDEIRKLKFEIGKIVSPYYDKHERELRKTYGSKNHFMMAMAGITANQFRDWSRNERVKAETGTSHREPKRGTSHDSDKRGMYHDNGDSTESKSDDIQLAVSNAIKQEQARQQAEQDHLVKTFNARIEREIKARIDAENKLKNPPKPTRNSANDQKIKDLEEELLKRTNSEREAKRKLAEAQRQIKDSESVKLAKAREDAKRTLAEHPPAKPDFSHLRNVDELGKHFHERRLNIEKCIKQLEDESQLLRAHQPIVIDSMEYNSITSWASRLSNISNEWINMIDLPERKF